MAGAGLMTRACTSPGPDVVGSLQPSVPLEPRDHVSVGEVGDPVDLGEVVGGAELAE